MMIEGSGSIHHTNGSGSGRPKNMWIQSRVGSGTLVFCSVSDPYSFFPDPDPDPEVEAGDQYGSGSGSNPGPGL
jgi:hypothetical protein